jgi:hypothetical protein
VLFSQSTAAVEHIHGRPHRSGTTRCRRSPSPGVDAPRSEPCGFVTAFSMQDPGFGVPRIHLSKRFDV